MGSLLRCTTCIIPQGKGWLLFDSFSFFLLFFLASILFLPVINLSSSLQLTKGLMILFQLLGSRGFYGIGLDHWICVMTMDMDMDWKWDH